VYGIKEYINRGSLFANNMLRPGNKKLATLMIYATDLCDSACKHCLIWAKRPPKHLPYEKFVEVMQSDCVTKNTMVGLEGGEFLLHPEALKIMEWLTINHPNFDLLSNCLKPDSLIEAVKKYTPKHLYISLDGTKGTYHYMRGKDGYDSVLKVIKELKDIVPISTMFTLSPYNNFDDMKHVAEVCKREGVDMRVGVYNDIAFFDTKDKAHENEVGTMKTDEVLKFKDIKNEKDDIAAKNEELNIAELADISQPKHNENATTLDNFKESIPQEIKEFGENYDFLVLYDEWRKKKLKLNCYSILDSLVILPNGDVPICQNLDLKLGNVNKQSLDDVFNGKATQKIHKEYVHNCNQCWINFHRKYDVILYRNLEKFFPKMITKKLFGYYQWTEDASMTYQKFMDEMEDTYK
jgi:MoaA/NifB/PqqE/SkfB family radical SAM enzyme